MAQHGGRVYADRITINPPVESEVDITSSPSTVNFYAFPSDPNGLLDADVGDRAWQIGSANKWRCTGGTAWTLDDGGGGTGNPWQITWVPGATTDETINLYGTWTEAHDAAATIRDLNLDVDIVIGSGGTDPYEIPAGTYDMSRIALVGYPAFEPLSALSFVVDTAVAGVVFENFTRGISYMTLRHNSPGALNAPGAGTTEVNLGRNCTWRSTDGLLWDITADATRFSLGDQVNLGAAEDAGVMLIAVDAGAAATFWCSTNDTIRDCFSGAGQFEVIQGTGSTSIANQTVVSGPFSITPAVTLPVELGVVLRPAAPDPGNGIYETFAEAYTAATNLSGKNVTIWVDNPGGQGSALVIPSGTYDLGRITLRGYTKVLSAALTPTHWLQTSNGTVFTNFVNGTYDLGLYHAGNAALCTLTLATTQTAIQIGERCLWIAATDEILRIAGTGNITMYMGPRCVWTNGGTDYEVLNLNVATVTASISVEGGDGAGPKQDTIRGAVGSTVTIGGLFTPETQANLAGTYTIVSTPSIIPYTPGTPADWVGGATFGFTTQQAIDRLAAAVEGLLGAPVP